MKTAPDSPHALLVATLCAVTVLAILVLDLYTPLSMADGMLYSIPVLWSLWVPRRSYTLTIALVSSGFIVWGFFISHLGEPRTLMTFANRALALLAVWVVALLVWQRQHSEREAQHKLESRVLERTAELMASNRRLQEEITRRERIEAALSASELHLRTVVAGAPVSLFVLDRHGVFQLCEGLGLKGLGLIPGEVVGASAFDICAGTQDMVAWIRRALRGEVVNGVLEVQEHWCDVRCTPLYDASDAVSGVIGVATDITERVLAEQQRLDTTRKQRDTLVREVHHRIKNNLQGVVGLLRQHGREHPELSDALDRVVTQIYSVAVVHGLQSERADSDIMLCDMVRAVTRAQQQLTASRSEPQVQVTVARPIRIAKEEAVPVALILNELTMNAVKHDTNAGDAVTITVGGDCERASVLIRNTGVLTDGFDFTSGTGLGTGLGLVRSLLPHTGANLSIRNHAEGVLAQLDLYPPVICTAPSPE